MVWKISETIGNTPLVHVKYAGNPMLIKLESFNPGGSIKDRVVANIITCAEKSGEIYPKSLIVEATSGNTGVAVAMLAAEKDYRSLIVTHDKASQEKIDAMRHYGAEVMIVNSKEPPESRDHYTQIARRIAVEKEGFLIDQFNNKLNSAAHFSGTGPEIWDQTQGRVTCVVCGMGSGGTISGIGRYLKLQNPSIKIIGVDPFGSIYSEKFYRVERRNPRPWTTEGVGSDFIPSIMDFSVVDDIVNFSDSQAIEAAISLRRRFGVNVGPSGGAAFHVAKNLDRNACGECIVVIAPDGADRYSSKLNSFVNQRNLEAF